MDLDNLPVYGFFDCKGKTKRLVALEDVAKLFAESHAPPGPDGYPRLPIDLSKNEAVANLLRWSHERINKPLR